MLVSGVVAGIVAGVAFGGDWRRLSVFSLRWWPLLVVASLTRLATVFFPRADLAIYLIGLCGIGLVGAVNWRLTGSALIAIGTFANVLVIFANSGMPYDASVVTAVGAPVPADGLHVVLTGTTRLPFFADIIPLGLVHAVYSIGDFVIAFGGFLIPFAWLQPQPTSAKHELRSANFSFFWLAQVISRFGDPITLVALTFVTYRSTQSALLTALAVTVATIPNALFGFIGGAIADSLGPRRAMLSCDIARTVLIGLIPVLLAFDAPLVVIFALAALAGIAGAVFSPARGALVPALVTRDRLAAANSVVYASDRAVEIIGALAGGVLVVTLGESAFYVDAITFALSAILLARVVVLEHPHPMSWAHLLPEAVEGLRFIGRSGLLRANTVFSLIAQFANPVINALTPVFLVRRFAGNDPVTGAVLYAGSEAAIAVGAVLASVILPRYLARLHKGHALIVGFFAFGVVTCVIALAPSYPIAVGLFVLLGFTNVVFYVPNVTILQEETPQNMTARVFGARIALTNLSWLPIILLGGVIGDAIGVDVFMLIAGLVTLTAAVVGAFVPVIRDVP